MKKRNWLRTTIAMLTLVATVLETGFTSVATMAADFTTDEGIEVNTDAIEESSSDSGDDLSIEVERDNSSENEEEAVAEEPAGSSEEQEAAPAEEVAAEEPVAEEGRSDADTFETSGDADTFKTAEGTELIEEPAAEEEVFEEAEELKEGKLDVDEDGIRGSGYDEISIYVVTENLANKDTFRIDFSGPDSASYNPVLNDELDKTNGGRYDFENLEGGDFSVRANSSSDVILSYRYNEDGYPTIYVESKPVEKVLETTTLSGNDGESINAITGSGYESIKIEFDTEELTDRAAFKFYVESNADAKVDGQSAIDGIDGNKETRSFTVEDLENEEFKVYIVSDNDLKLDTSIRVASIDNGEVELVLSVISTKREYVYEDDDVIVTALLEKVDAIPDDAEFVVTKITPQTNGYNYEAYIQALNDNADKITGEEDSTIEKKDVLLYDVAFYVTDENGNRIELQPEEGSVGINIGFKNYQLAEELEASSDSEVKIVHLPLYDDVKENVDTTAEATNITADDIAVEVVESNTSVAGESAVFELTDFSVIATVSMTENKMLPGPSETFRSVLGDLSGFGIVANEVTLGGDLESTMAVGTLHGNKDIKGPKNDGNNAGVTYIGHYDGTGMIYDRGEATRSNLLIYTTPEAYKNMGTNMTNGRNGVDVDTTTYTKEQIQKKVSDLVEAAQKKSDALATVESYKFDEIKTGDTTIDIKDRGSDAYGRPLPGTYYVTFNDGQFNSVGKLNIILGEGQNVVFNIPDKTVTVHQFDIEIDGKNWTTAGQSDEDPVCQRVIFNAPNATETHTDNTSGLFLFPYSDFSIANVSAGWIVADTISKIGGAEWHFVWHDLPPSKSVPLELHAKKTVNGNPPSGNEVFKFDLYRWNFKTHKAEFIETKTNDGSDISFTSQVVSSAGTYSYIIIEQMTTLDGYVIDARPYNIHYTVTESGGKLHASAPTVYRMKTDFDESKLNDRTYWNNNDNKGSSLDAVVFNNTIEEEPESDVFEYDIRAKKEIYVGEKKNDYHDEEVLENWPAGLSFEFKLEYEDEFKSDNFTTQSRKRLPGGVAGPITKTISWNTPDKTVSFGKVRLDAKTVYEDALANDYEAKKRNNGITWNGAYPNDGDKQNAKKFLVSEGLDERLFNGNNLRCTVYKYMITEQRNKTLPDGFSYGSGGDGEHFDRHIKLFVYTYKWGNSYKVVSLNITCDVDHKQSVLQYNPKYVDENRYHGNGLPCIVWDNRPLEFYNRYIKRIPDSEKTTIYGVKNYNGVASDLPGFQFTISTAASGDAIADPKLAQRVNNKLTVACGTDAQFNFGQMQYEYSDIPTGQNSVKYHYIITEEGVSDQPDENGNYYLIAKPSIKVVNKSVEFDVTVYDDGSQKLKISNPKASPNTENAEFTNVYGADGSITFGVDKKFTNESETAELPTPQTFKFRLEGGRVENGKVVSDQVNEPIEITIAKGATTGSKSFSEIKYANLDAKGTYKYTISEELPSGISEDDKNAAYNEEGKFYLINGIKYDARKYNITLVLKDNNNGKLVPESVLAGYEGQERPQLNPENITVLTAQFENKYDFDPVEDYIFGQKKLGGGKEITKEKFTFNLAADADYGDDIVMPETTSVQNGVIEGKAPSYFEFGKITFKQAGTYSFTVTEDESAGVDLSGMNLGDKEESERDKYGFDNSPLKVTFNVTKDKFGVLHVKKNEPSGGVVFTNPYGSGGIELYAKKKFWAPLGYSEQLSHDFSFKLEPVAENGFATDSKNFKNGALVTTNSGDTDWNNGFAVTPEGGLKYDLSMLNRDSNGNRVETKFKYRISEDISDDVRAALNAKGIYKGFKYGLALNVSEDDVKNGTAQPLQLMSYDVTVTVKPDASAENGISATADNFSADNPGETLVKFLNSYVPAPDTFSIIGQKKLEGRTRKNADGEEEEVGFITGEYGDHFKVTLTDPAGNAQKTDVVISSGNTVGSFSFNNIEVNNQMLYGENKWEPYDDNNNYLFTVKEEAGGWATTADGTANGKKIAAGTNDTHTFYVLVQIREVDGQVKVLNKAVYSDKDCTQLVDNEDANGNIEVPLIRFTNTYTNPGSVKIPATKYYTGELKGGEFTFYLRDKDTPLDVNGNVLTATNGEKGVGNILFDDIEYSFDGTASATTADGTVIQLAPKANFDTIEDGTAQVYEYTITEKVDQSNKYTVDADGNYVKGYIRYYGVADTDTETEYKDVYNVKVYVKETTENGVKKLVADPAEIEFFDLTDDNAKKSEAAISNERILKTNVSIPVTKVFEAPADSARAFTFTLTGKKNVNGNQVDRKLTRTITVGGGKKEQAVFDPEAPSAEDGVNIDMLEFTQDDLDAKVSEAKDGKFVKHFTLTEDHPSDAVLVSTTIEAEDENGNKVEKTIPAYYKDGTLYDGRTYTVDVYLWMDESKPAEIQKEWIAYESGTEAPVTDAEQYDSFLGSLLHKVWISVKGIFGVANEKQNTVFINSYKSKGELKLSARKIMDLLPEGKTIADYDFKFILEGKNEDGDDIAADPVSIDPATLIADFGTVTYTKTREYVYKIREFVPETGENGVPRTKDEQGRWVVDGVHYDANEYTINVSVTDPNHDGKLVVTAAVSGDTKGYTSQVNVDTENGTYTYVPCEYQADFTNTYDAKPIEVELKGIKTVNEGTALNAGDFKFALCDESGTPLGNEYVVTNDAEGNFIFPKLPAYTLDQLKDDATATYKESKEYKYVIREYTTKEELGDKYSNEIQYDTHTVNVTVTITNSNGVLSATVVTDDSKGISVTRYDAEGNPVEESYNDNVVLVSAKVAEFHNRSFDPEKEKFAVTKIVEGPVDPEKVFTFKIAGDIPADWAEKKLDTVTLKAGETKEFPELEYKYSDLTPVDGSKRSRTYTYTVSEEDGGDDAYEYSKEVYTATVTVESDGEARGLTKTTTIKNKAGKEYNKTAMEFINTAKAEGFAHVDGIKTLINKSIGRGDFTFILADDDPATEDAVYTSVGKKLNPDTLTAVEEFSFTGNPDASDQTKLLYYDQEALKDKNGEYQKSVTKHYTVTEKHPEGEKDEKPADDKDRYRGIHYAEDVYDVYVTIEYDGTSKLKVSDPVDMYRRGDPAVQAGPDAPANRKPAASESENPINRFFSELIKKITGSSSDDAGKIKADEKGKVLASFINDYNAKCIIDPPIMKKYMMGKTITRGEFSFEITGPGLRSTDNVKEGFKTTVRNGLNNELDNFKEVWPAEAEYDHNGKYIEDPGEIYVGGITYFINDLDYNPETDRFEKSVTYHAKELNPNNEENFSAAEFELSFLVYDNGDGTLNTEPTLPEMKEAGWTYIEGTGNGFKVDGFDFVNIKNQEAKINLVGKKTLDLRPITEDDQFRFTLTDETDPANKWVSKPVTVKVDPKTGLYDTVEFNADDIEFESDAMAQKAATEHYSFLDYKSGIFKNDGSEITDEDKMDTEGGLLHSYTDAGEKGEGKVYTYRITEEQITGGGITCDSKEYVVKVNVALEGEKGKEQLVASIPNGGDKWEDNTKTVGNDDRTYNFKPISSETKDGINVSTYDAFKFDNKFNATGAFKLTGKKKVVDEQNKVLSSPDALLNQYEFALYSFTNEARTEGKQLAANPVKCDAEGNFTIEVPTFDATVLTDESGKFSPEVKKYYKLIEVKPSVGKWADDAHTIWESDGVIYDNTEYDIDVDIKLVPNSPDLAVTGTIRNSTTGETTSDLEYVMNYTNISKEYTVIEGNKYWIDNFTNPADRPNVTVNLYKRTASGVETKINSYTIVAPDTTYRFATDSAGNKLPRYDSDKKPITYIVEETPIENYLSEKVNYDFYNTAGDILIRKIDADTRAPLSGAVLAIMDGTKEVERWTSGASAHVVEAVLEGGKTYTLHEVSAPDGYVVAADMTFTVPTNGSSITVTMSDPPIYGSVRLTKRDEATRDTLAGAEFALYREDGARMFATGTTGSYRATDTTSNGVFVTDASGMLEITDLPYGTYYFVETKAPDGYARSSERLGFTILRNGELVEVTMLDPKALGAARIRKVDGRDGRVLAGAVFELYSSTPRTLGQAASSTIFSDAYYRYGTYRTNSRGEIYVDELPWGDYYFIEVDAPAGYEILRDVNGDDLVYTFRVTATTADITIDLGDVVNYPTPPTTPPTPPTTPPTPPTVPPTTPPTTPPRSGVLGERVAPGGVVSGVLGVRAKPNSGVLGERVGPVTGDASNIILWSLLLAACIATIVATIMTGRKKKAAR